MNGKIRELRESMHLSQEALGKRLHLSQQAVSRVERDYSTMTLEHLLIYSEFFKVSTDYILGKTENPGNDSSLGAASAEICEDRGLLKIYKHLNQDHRELLWTMIEKMAQQESRRGDGNAGNSDL